MCECVCVCGVLKFANQNTIVEKFWKNQIITITINGVWAYSMEAQPAIKKEEEEEIITINKSICDFLF